MADFQYLHIILNIISKYVYKTAFPIELLERWCAFGVFFAATFPQDGRFGYDPLYVAFYLSPFINGEVANALY